MGPEIKIFPIGDSAATIELGNCIEDGVNQKIVAMNEWLSLNPFSGLKDIIIAYSSLSVLFDPCTVKKNYPRFSSAFACVHYHLGETFNNSANSSPQMHREIIRMPVCYEEQFGYDLEFIAKEKKISKEDIVRLHCSKVYHVYMVGFLPGFAYMGKLSEELILSRKMRPEQVSAGSVGITGSQTAIYPMNCPGGWHIIGKTPIRLFDAYLPVPILLTLGAQIEFFPISMEEFDHISQTEKDSPAEKEGR
jgi:inhibitor of KinA